MGNTQAREQIHLLIDNVQDEAFLRALHAMLSTYLDTEADPIIGYELDGRAVRASEARAELLAEVETARNGEYYTLEDIRDEDI